MELEHTPGVAVVATDLARTDRRALSQAWYSALHLTSPPRALDAHASRAAFRAATRSSRHLPAHRVSAAPVDATRKEHVVPRSSGRATDAPPPGERRAPKSELATRIERALIRRSPREAAASFAVRALDGRVQVMVRRERAGTRIVAVCAPALRDRVEQALAQARFALAGQALYVEAAR